MGYENLGYLLAGAAIAVGILAFLLGGRLARSSLRIAGFVLAFLGLLAGFAWGIQVGAVRARVQTTKRETVIPAPGERVPHGFGEDPQELVRGWQRDLERARDTARAYGWKWEDL